MRMTTGNFQLQFLGRGHHAAGEHVAAQNPTENIDEYAFHALVADQNLERVFHLSAEAPPPTSRKFAGEPPESLMMSIVPMASPAPFTMQPTLPSSLM